MTLMDLINILTTGSSCRDALPCMNMALKLPGTGFLKWGRLVGEDNLGKMAKKCMKMTKSAFLGQNSGGGTWGRGGGQANFWGSGGGGGGGWFPKSPPTRGNPAVFLPADGEASWLLLPSLVYLLSGGIVQLLIKLQALALVTLLTYIHYITTYITSILLLIFLYYLLAPVANFWKQTHLERSMYLCYLSKAFFTKCTPS